MSYDVTLRYPDARGVCFADRHYEGGTINIDGSVETSMSVTYNYANFFYEYLDKEEGLRWLYRKTGKETIPALKKAVEALGTQRDKDYWASTPGNAGYALSILLKWAMLNPDAVWEGD